METSRDTSTPAMWAATQTPIWPNDPLFPVQWHLHNTGNTPYSVAGYDINVLPVWPDYSGKGQLVVALDDAFDETHPDLIANYRADLAWHLSHHSTGAGSRPWEEGLSHGTSVAGLIAATANNGLGGVGVAWGAEITGYRYAIQLDFDIPLEQNVYLLFSDSVAKAVEQGVDVYNNSWGTIRPYPVAGEWQAYMHAAARNLVELGRDGLGIITVFSAGNERDVGLNANYDPVVSMPWVIAVAAGGQDGGVVSYSTPGASVLITAPGSWPASIVTTDWQSAYGSNRRHAEEGDYTDREGTYFSGTSTAAPVVSGVAALMLEANSGLGWRDVQEILAYSARRATFLDRDAIVDPSNSGEFPPYALDKAFNGAHDWNGGAHLVSHDFGFGHVDAHAAVRLAESWMKVSTLANLVEVNGEVGRRELAVEPGDQATATATFSSPYRVEHMSVTVDLSTDHLPAITLELISPDGTVSRLINHPQPLDGYENPAPLPTRVEYAMDSVQSWGENLAGTWTLRLTNDADGTVAHLNDWSITAYTAGAVDAAEGQQIFTSEYLRFAQEDPSRTTLHAENGVTLNAAPVVHDVVFDLSGGPGGGDAAGISAALAQLTSGGSQIGDAAIVLAEPGAFRHLISGDGNDTLVGNAAGNILMPGRGTNFVDGGAGLDVLRLIGPSAHYTVTHHDERITVHSHVLSGGGVDHAYNVELLHFADQVMLTHTPQVNGPDAFDEAGYLLQNPDVALAVGNGHIASARQHYEEWGQHEGRNPNSLFSEAWYLAANPDVADAVAQGRIANGFEHYTTTGWHEGRAPSAWMDAGAYLSANPDVAAAGMDPLLHYLQHGYIEGRTIQALATDLWG